MLTEVATLKLGDVASETTEYWFVFQNGRLVQWGLPDDWQSVSARYDINFNPKTSVRP